MSCAECSLSRKQWVQTLASLSLAGGASAFEGPQGLLGLWHFSSSLMDSSWVTGSLQAYCLFLAWGFF